MDQRKVVLYIAASLDGYIATNEHKLDWLFAVEGEGDNGYSRFLETVDTILMGRVTYDWIMEHENGAFPYRGKECFVFTRADKAADENVTYINGDIVRFLADLKSKNGKKIWLVGGGDLLSSFIREKRVDEIIINIAPVLIGKGIPLFMKNEFETALTLKGINRFNQFAELTYDVKK